MATMNRLTTLPTDRFIYPSSEPMPEPQTLLDGWAVQQNEPVQIGAVVRPGEAPKLRPNLHAELMESLSRIIGIIAVVLVAATIIAQLTKRSELGPEGVAVARGQWDGHRREGSDLR